MSRAVVFRCCLFTVALATPTGGAQAHSTGGAEAPSTPQVEEIRCLTGDVCAPGDLLRLSGDRLATARAVVFTGEQGRADDRRSVARRATLHRVLVRIPVTARSGPVRVVTDGAGTSVAGPRLQLTAPESDTAVAMAPTDGVFPLRGAYDFGTSVNGFGGGRNHQGQDILAPCGRRVVAALGGTVSVARYQAAAGNFVVVDGDDGSSQVYMHLLEPASVRPGDAVGPGEAIGEVGRSGRATACHLHFEAWTAPGWYRGGSPVDPLPRLEQWAEAT